MEYHLMGLPTICPCQLDRRKRTSYCTKWTITIKNSQRHIKEYVKDYGDRTIATRQM